MTDLIVDLAEQNEQLATALRNIIDGYTLMVNADNALKRGAMSDFLNMAIAEAERLLEERDYPTQA